LIDLKLVPQESILFQCVGGSHAYGLNSAESDIDHRGVFIADKNDFLRGAFTEDESNETNDNVLFEVGKFIRLLAKSNPSVVEFIAIPDDCVQVGKEWIHSIDHSKVLSKQCKDSFAGYALSQIRKARKIKGMIHVPESDDRKSALDFLHVLGTEQLIKFDEWQTQQSKALGFRQLDRFIQIVEVHDDKPMIDVSGELILGENKGAKVLGWASLSESEWKSYQKTYKTYWTWKKLQKDGQELHHDYNAKNVMHAFRLVLMGIELARTGKLVVRREADRAFLLEVRQYQHAYEDLVIKLESSLVEMNEAFAQSSLPAIPDINYLNDFLCATRKFAYSLE
jgi:predicted nucleotidyltransferase